MTNEVPATLHCVAQMMRRHGTRSLNTMPVNRKGNRNKSSENLTQLIIMPRLAPEPSQVQTARSKEGHLVSVHLIIASSAAADSTWTVLLSRKD